MSLLTQTEVTLEGGPLDGRTVVHHSWQFTGVFELSPDCKVMHHYRRNESGAYAHCCSTEVPPESLFSPLLEDSAKFIALKSCLMRRVNQ